MFLPSIWIVSTYMLNAAVAAPQSNHQVFDKRQTALATTALNKIDSALSPFVNGLAADLKTGASVFSTISNAIQDNIRESSASAPTSIPQVLSLAKNIFINPIILVKNVVKLVASGISPSQSDLAFLKGTFTAENSQTNNNPRQPATTIYPRKSNGDPAYSVSEQSLRGAIYIPSTFTYGKKHPVILTPGTGNTGWQTYNGNFIPLLTGVSYADPVWLNIPGLLLEDAQVNAEYVAYAINYISGITSRNVSVIAWSQGTLDTQWALKYFRSTRSSVSNLIGLSGDYQGTTLAHLLCPAFPNLPCAPSVQQQASGSRFLATLARSDGAGAYVPTTNVYSATDEIVQPQFGPGASGRMADPRRVGVTNAEVQVACLARPAGAFYLHEGILYHPLAFALVKDALTNGGPGQLSRVGLMSTCSKGTTDGLSLANVLATENSIVLAALALLSYANGTADEPAIASYAV